MVLDSGRAVLRLATGSGLAGQVAAAGAAVVLAAWLAGPVIARRCQRRSPGGSRGGL